MVGLILVLALSTGCSGDDEPDAPTSSGSPQPGAVRTTTKVSEITGALAKKDRQRVVKGVTRVVDGWFDAAFLDDAGNPFPGFTAGAAKLARRDADIMTAAGIEGAGEGVVAVRRRVTLDVLAARKRAVGVTAGVHLVLQAGDDGQRYVVRGTLQLERDKADWRIFGYRISAGPESAAPSDRPKDRQKQDRPKKEGKR